MLDWLEVTRADIRAIKQERRRLWRNLVSNVPYERSVLKRLKRIALANLPPGGIADQNFDELVSRRVAQYGRWYVMHEATGWVPDVVSPREFLVLPGAPANAVAAAFADVMCAGQPMRQARRSRGRPAWREFRCWIGLLAEAWQGFGYLATVTHDSDDDRRGTENEKFGRFAEFVEGWVERAQSDTAPAENWWPKNRSARAHVIDAVLRELRECRKPIKGGPFAAHEELRLHTLQKITFVDEFGNRVVPPPVVCLRRSDSTNRFSPL